MSTKANDRTSFILLILQIVFAGFFCISELFHLLQAETIAGVGVTMFVAVEVFLGINLFLSFQTYKEQLKTGKPAKATKWAFWTYAYWFILWGACLAAVAIKLYDNFSVVLTTSEYVTTASVAIGLAGVYIYKKRTGSTFKDPMVKGYTALVFKSFPQFGQAWKFFAFGGMSWAFESLIFGHVTIWIRILQLYLAKRETGKWTRNLKGSLVSEVWNEISWLTATGVWLWWKFV